MLALAERPRYFSRTHCRCNALSAVLLPLYSNIYEFVTSFPAIAVGLSLFLTAEDYRQRGRDKLHRDFQKAVEDFNQVLHLNGNDASAFCAARNLTD